MVDQDTTRLLARLRDLCEAIANGQYAQADDLLELTKVGTYPAIVTALSECFGLMMVKVEAREFRLLRMIEELRDSHEKLAATFDGALLALASAIEKRDPYTAGHQQRVGRLAAAVACEMGLPDEVAEGVRVAGNVHDIGKIGIPAEILCKPAVLTGAEFELIKSHPGAGAEILKNVRFPWPVATIALQHHEKIDGSGYPAGLRGPDIHVGARLVAVADVVEAMSSHRPYRAALGTERALDEITKKSGTHFDGDAVQACIRLFERKGYTIE